MGVALFTCFLCKAEKIVPCLIFSGNAETEHCIDLAKLNRITFGHNSMVISSSREDDDSSVELLYSLYHHLEVRDAEPSNIDVGLETIDAESGSRLYFDSQSRLLYLQSSSDSEFSIGIFDLEGKLLLKSELKDGDSLPLETLDPGIYIAIASDSKIKIDLKFIFN